MTTLSLTNTGFDLVWGTADSVHIQWNDIEEIVAFKIDLHTYDTIRLGFQVRGFSELYEIDEDWPGYKEVMAELERRFRLDGSWWSHVDVPLIVETSKQTCDAVE